MITKGLGDGKLLTKGLGGFIAGLHEIVKFVAKITTKILYK